MVPNLQHSGGNMKIKYYNIIINVVLKQTYRLLKLYIIMSKILSKKHLEKPFKIFFKWQYFFLQLF